MIEPDGRFHSCFGPAVCECGPEKSKTCGCKKCKTARGDEEESGLPRDGAEPDSFMSRVETLLARLRGLVEGTER